VSQHLDDQLNAATDSAVGRFIYKFVMPLTFALLGWLGVRAIDSLDAQMKQLQTASEAQSATQSEIQGEVRAIRAQMDYQTRYQELVDAEQNKELDRHARALNLK
jgi:muconolactone delta-isomerase